jgi:hypothetical protein
MIRRCRCRCEVCVCVCVCVYVCMMCAFVLYMVPRKAKNNSSCHSFYNI